MPETHGLAGLVELLEHIGRSVVLHHTMKLDPLAGEPGHSTGKKADHS